MFRQSRPLAFLANKPQHQRMQQGSPDRISKTLQSDWGIGRLAFPTTNLLFSLGWQDFPKHVLHTKLTRAEDHTVVWFSYIMFCQIHKFSLRIDAGGSHQGHVNERFHCVSCVKIDPAPISWFFLEPTNVGIKHSNYIMCSSRLQTSHTTKGPSRSCSRSCLQTSDQHFTRLPLIKSANAEETN